MKSQLPAKKSLVEVLCLLFFAAFCSHAGADLVLDVAASGKGKVSDGSKSGRELKARKLSPGVGAGTVLFQENSAIILPFKAGDPLFVSGPCTWMMRCRISEIHPQNSYLIAGRWEGRDDQRIMMLGIGQKIGRAMFQVSSAGSLEERRVATTQSAVPTGEWVTVVGRFEPGTSIAVKLFNESGELIDETNVMSNVPAELPDLPVDLSIGRSVPAEMEFSRFRIWNSALPDDEIKTAVAEK